MCVSVTSVTDVLRLNTPPCFYDVLGVSMKATDEEIRYSYRKLVREWHPDRHGGSDLAKRKFQQIQLAYEVLSNKQRRAQHDLAWLSLLDVEDYLSRYQDFILTANGLCMSLGSIAQCCDPGSGMPVDGDGASAQPPLRRPTVTAA